MNDSVGRLQLRLHTAIEGLKNHINKTRDYSSRHPQPIEDAADFSQKKLSEAYRALQGVRAREDAYLAEISTLRKDLDSLRESYKQKQGVIDVLKRSLDTDAHDIYDHSKKELVTRTDELAHKLDSLHDEVIKTQEHNLKVLNEKDLRISELKATIKSLELSLRLRDDRIKELTATRKEPQTNQQLQLAQVKITNPQPMQFAPLVKLTVPEASIQPYNPSRRLIEEMPQLQLESHHTSQSSRRTHFSWPPASFA